MNALNARSDIENMRRGKIDLLLGVVAYGILLSAVFLPQTFVAYPTMAFDWIRECLLESAELSLQFDVGLRGF